MRSNRLRRQAALRRAVADLVADGYAVCRIDPDEKRPSYAWWGVRSLGPDDFGPGDGVGIVCGPLSGPAGHALVCVDLDADDAVRLADRYLPPTGMEDGRDGKPRSHRWFSVSLSGVGAEHHSHARQSAPVMVREYGHPGPATKSFRGGDRREVVKLIGTGGQAAVPPSRHPSGERRVWAGGRRGEPAVVNFRTLSRAVRRLARRCGWAPEPGPAAAPPDTADAPDTTVGPRLAYRINRYLDRLPASVSGRGGHDACYYAACVLVWGYALGEADALIFLRRFNARCVPKWSGGELLHKVRDAATATDHSKPRGHLL